jgi:hypothetical protein
VVSGVPSAQRCRQRDRLPRARPSGWLLRTDRSVPAAPDLPVSLVPLAAVVIGTSLWSLDLGLAGLAEHVTVGAVASLTTIVIVCKDPTQQHRSSPCRTDRLRRRKPRRPAIVTADPLPEHGLLTAM